MTDKYEHYNLNFISADGSIKSIVAFAHNLRKMNFFSALIDEGEQQFGCLFIQMNANNITILNNEYLKYDSFILLLNFLVHGSNSEQMNNAYALRAFKEAANFCQAEGVLEDFINQEKSNISAFQFINAHYPAQLIYDAYKEQLNVECLIDEFLKYRCYSESLICSLGYTAKQLQKNNICLDAVVQANCFSHEEVISAYGASSALEFMNAGISLMELAKHGHNGYGLKDTQYSAIELKGVGFNAYQLKTAGFTAVELKAAGCSAQELKSARFIAKELKLANFTAVELKAVGFDVRDLRWAGFTAGALKKSGFTAAELKVAGFFIQELKAAYFSAGELKEAGFSLWQLNVADFTALELKEADFTALELKEVGFPAWQVIEAGFNEEQLISASYSLEHLINIGFNASQLTPAYLSYFKTEKLAHTTIVNMRAFDKFFANDMDGASQQAQYYDELISIKALTFCGFRQKGIINDVIKIKAHITHCRNTFLDIGNANKYGRYFNSDRYCTHDYYDVREVLAICFKKSGVSAKDLKEAGFSVTHLKVAEFTLNEIITAGYTLKEIRQSHQYSDAKITKEANTISGQSHQPELTYQLREMRHANDCCSAM